MNTTLSTLVMDFNRTLGSNGVEALCRGLATNSTLKKLSLKHCNIDENGGQPIAKMLLFKKLGLMSLDLTCNRLGGKGLSDMCIGLIENSSLKTFRLADNSVGQADHDIKALTKFSEVLVKHPSLVAVDLLHNKIGSNGGQIILPSLRENRRITTFKIDSNMDDKIFEALFRVSTSSRKDSKNKSKANT